jgi:Mg-chelatase subunit ChlD
MTAVFKPVGVKVPPVFHQLGLLVLDGSGSMTEMGPFNTSKAKHVSAAVVELFNRMNVSRVKQNFSFACIKFDNSPTLSLSPTAFDHSVLMNQNFDPTDGKGGGTQIFEALNEAQKIAENFLSSAPADGLPHKVLILLMSDGMCFQPNTTKTVATNIKINPKVQIACAYFGEVGKIDADAQDLLKGVCSDLGSGPAFTTVYDGEALRAFFERSISQSSGTKIE